MTEAARAAAFAAQADRSREIAAAHVRQMLATAAQMRGLRDNIASVLSHFRIEHRWSGTRLDIMGPDGEWVEGPNLLGQPGREVEVRIHEASIQWRHTGGDWMDLIALSELVGPTGREVELQVTGTHIQWRLEGGSWANLIALSELVGPPGREVELQVTGTHIQWRLEGGSWVDLIALSELAGADGHEVELQVTGMHIQWRLEGGSWANLIALSELAGADGREVELQVTGTHIQWRLEGGSWVNLIALPELAGPPGTTDYNALSNRPTLGTAAAAAIGDFATAAQGALAATAVQPARSLSAGTGLTGGGNLSADRSFAVDKATLANVRAAAFNKVLTADLIESAAALVTLTYASSVAINWDAFVVGDLTCTGNPTIANPTNVQPGVARWFFAFGSDATERAIAWGSAYKGDLPDITVTSTRGLLIAMMPRASGMVAVSHLVLE